GKKVENVQARNIEGLRLNKPKSSFVYQPKAPSNTNNKPTADESINVIKLKNNFDSLRDEDVLIRGVEVGEPSGAEYDKGVFGDQEPNIVDTNSEVEEAFIESVLKATDYKGASTPSTDVLDV
ncbi:hypothetical protein Tco_0936294, partial [Tanacetum coccineum]